MRLFFCMSTAEQLWAKERAALANPFVTLYNDKKRLIKQEVAVGLALAVACGASQYRWDPLDQLGYLP